MAERTTEVTVDAPTQGIMTVEVGAITGTVALRLVPSADGVHATVAYAGAHEEYTVQGSPCQYLATGAEVLSRLLEEGERATRL